MEFYAFCLLAVLRQRVLELRLAHSLVFGAGQFPQHAAFPLLIPLGYLLRLLPRTQLAQLAEYPDAVFQLSHPVQESALIKADP